jgi:TonB family protein
MKTMTISREVKWVSGSFLLSLLLHLLVLFTLVAHITFSLRKEPVPPRNNYVPPHNDYVPSYVYSGKVAPPTPPTPKVTPTQSKQSTPTSKPNITSSKSNTASTKPSSSVLKPTAHPLPKMKSLFATANPWSNGNMMSANTDESASKSEELDNEQLAAAMRRAKSQDPMLLIGEVSSMADPLVTLIGHSLSKHFDYPRVEGNFGIRGKVLVEMILHPDGIFSNIRIIESSENQDFDAAALYAVNAAPKVVGADQFITQPKYLVIGFIFD